MPSFLDMLQNDPTVQQKMDVLLGRSGTAAAGQAGMPQASTWDPASQPTADNPNPKYAPYMGDPFTYGLYGGEHNFFGAEPAAGSDAGAGTTTPDPTGIDQYKISGAPYFSAPGVGPNPAQPKGDLWQFAEPWSTVNPNNGYQYVRLPTDAIGYYNPNSGDFVLDDGKDQNDYSD